MTNHDITHVLASIGEAKRALDAEPQYIHRIDELVKHNEELGRTIGHRELRIHELKNENSALIQQLRSVEAERDDAGFRHLEEADKVQALLTLVRQIGGDILKCVSAIEGTPLVVVNQHELDNDRTELHNLRLDAEAELERNAKLERQCAESEALVVSLSESLKLAQEQISPRPFSDKVDMDSIRSNEGSRWDAEAERITDWPSSLSPKTEVEDKHVADPFPVSASAPTPQALGDAEPHATVEAGQSDGPFAPTASTEPVSASSPIAEPSADAPSPASPPERNRDPATRYKGRRYFDVTYYVPLYAWLEGGGTQEDYIWRPDGGVSRASHYSS